MPRRVLHLPDDVFADARVAEFLNCFRSGEWREETNQRRAGAQFADFRLGRSIDLDDHICVPWVADLRPYLLIRLIRNQCSKTGTGLYQQWQSPFETGCLERAIEAAGAGVEALLRETEGGRTR